MTDVSGTSGSLSPTRTPWELSATGCCLRCAAWASPRAVRLICDWALRDLAVPGLWLLAEPANLASRRVAERTGFRRIGLLPSNAEAGGRPVDHLLVSLIAHDHARRRLHS